MGKKGEQGLYQRGNTWRIRYFHNGKRIRKAIGTKGEARNELTAIRAKIDGSTWRPSERRRGPRRRCHFPIG